MHSKPISTVGKISLVELTARTESAVWDYPRTLWGDNVMRFQDLQEVLHVHGRETHSRVIPVSPLDTSLGSRGLRLQWSLLYGSGPHVQLYGWMRKDSPSTVRFAAYRCGDCKTIVIGQPVVSIREHATMHELRMECYGGKHTFLRLFYDKPWL